MATPVAQLLIAIPSAYGRIIREATSHVREVAAVIGRNTPTRVIAGVRGLISGEVSIDRIRGGVKVRDLLRRPTVELDLASIRTYVQGRTLMLTGASVRSLLP